MNVQAPVSHLLSDEEVAHYHEHGYVIPKWRLPDDLLKRMQDDLEKLLAEKGTDVSNSIFCPHIFEGGEKWLDYASIPEMLDMVEQVMGPDILLWGTTVFGKPAHSGKKIPWHQDGEYWPIRPLATCSAWIALDPATPENGCLRVIPGSHKRKRLMGHTQNDSKDLVLNQELNQDEYDEATAVDIVLEPGQFSLHDVYLAHGSEPNRSDQRRAGYVCRYQPTTSHFDREYGAELQARSGNQVDFVNRPLWLLRGEDKCGQNDLEHGHRS